ncbi:MAG TPA: hypothetical protein VMS76_03220 [Planctomycetota bacterium]|nr:hypothetical protein [Planctomycetota bacterium]
MLNGACIALALAPGLVSSMNGSQGRFVETFRGGNVEANWEILMSSGTSAVVPEGGHPGAHLVNTIQCCWPAPVVRTIAPASIFTGDYRALGVKTLGLDMTMRLAQPAPHPDFSMTLMLVHDNGTPANSADDTWVYLNLAKPIPWPGQGWKSYDFRVPSQLDLPFGVLPLGWKFYQDPFGGPPLANHTWREVMENVSQVWFLGINDPAAIGAFWNWRLGVDNLRITWGPPLAGP